MSKTLTSVLRGGRLEKEIKKELIGLYYFNLIPWTVQAPYLDECDYDFCGYAAGNIYYKK